VEADYKLKKVFQRENEDDDLMPFNFKIRGVTLAHLHTKWSVKMINSKTRMLTTKIQLWW
jgi:hypothetical protein